MNGAALALVENLDAAGGQPRFDLGAGEAVGDRTIVGVDVDVIVDADPAHAPLAVFVRLVRQRVERRAIDLLEELAAGDAEPPEDLFFVELGHKLAERGVDVGEGDEGSRLSRPSSHRSTISTACSTFALSRGFLGLAGRMALP